MLILDTIIDMENKFIRAKKRNPTLLKINYQMYKLLIKELEADYFIDTVHGMKLRIVDNKKLELE